VIEILESGKEMGDQLPEQPTRKGKSRVNQVIDRLRLWIEKMVRMEPGYIFKEQELKRIAGSSVSDQDFDKALLRLNEQEGILLVTGSGGYRHHAAC